MTPPLVVPRSVPAASATSDDVPPGMYVRTQSGVTQLRDVDRAGRVWREDYPLVSARSVADNAWRTRLQWFRARSRFFWIDHPLLPGSGVSPNGTGEENLLRDAAMDTDTSGDGVVDGFQKFRDEGTGWSFSLFATGGAQQFTADGTGSSGERASVEQFVLRVFPGDEVVGSVDGFLTSGSTDLEGRLFLQFEKSDGSSIAGAPVTTWTDTTSQRRVVTTTAPAEAARVRFIVGARLTADSGSGDARVRDARLLRAASDPATWANPHVSGASQTGSTLDTSGWPASQTNVVRAGDIFKIGGSGETKAAAETDEVHRTFKVLTDADADGNGDATLDIDPPIFSGGAPPDGAALRLTNLRLRASLVPDRTSLQGPSRAVDKYGGLSATYAEAI